MELPWTLDGTAFVGAAGLMRLWLLMRMARCMDTTGTIVVVPKIRLVVRSKGDCPSDPLNIKDPAVAPCIVMVTPT